MVSFPWSLPRDSEYHLALFISPVFHGFWSWGFVTIKTDQGRGGERGEKREIGTASPFLQLTKATYYPLPVRSWAADLLLGGRWAVARRLMYLLSPWALILAGCSAMPFQCEVRWLVVVCWSCRCGVMKTLPGVENRLGDAISSAAGKPFPDTGSGLLLLQLMGNDSCGSHHLSVSRREDRDPGSLFKLRMVCRLRDILQNILYQYPSKSSRSW